jgi:hypothetical protein
MKKMFMSLFIFFSSYAVAVEIKFIGPCQKDPIISMQVSDTFSNVGELTVATLIKYKLPFKGNAQGINSIFNTPTGLEALEVISDIEMRAYGWCYSVDGVAPEVFPHEVRVTSKTQSIVWHYGFAHFYKGEWITQCTPAYTVKPSVMCQSVE